MKNIIRGVLAAAALASTAWAGGKYTEEQLAARYSWDLGPASVDVSGYPKEQQENYKVFSTECVRCHTLARPLNAPYSSAKDWNRYVKRMHIRAKSQYGAGFFKAEAKAIIDFLVYDAKVRKLDGKAAFEAQDKELRALFQDVKKERGRLQVENDRKKAKANPMGPEVKPQP